jgi:hypothetical protein
VEQAAFANRSEEICHETVSVEDVKSDVENSRQEKQLAGRCVRKACRAAATDGDYCTKHAGLQRAYHRLYMRRQREQWDEEDKCTRCGGVRAPESRWCTGCIVMVGRVPRSVVKSDVENHAARVAARKIEWQDSPTNQGRKNRLRGGKRGRRSIADDDAERMLSMRKFVEKLSDGLVYSASEQVKQLGRIQRDDAKAAAMSWAALIYRTCAEMMAANGYELPTITTEDDEDEDT